MPVYRADYAPLAGIVPRIIGETVDRHPEWQTALTTLASALVDGSESRIRFHQVCGAVTRRRWRTACSIGPLASCRSSRSVATGCRRLLSCEFHLRAHERARFWPRTMTTLSTHDTKRGEDVRARIGVLSQVPELWARCVADWEMSAPSPDGVLGLMMWQNMFGVWPVDGPSPDGADLRPRLHAYAEKAAREAGVRTSWTAIDTKFEDALHEWIDRVLDGPVGRSIGRIAQHLAPPRLVDALGQKLLQLCGPGIPDVYQAPNCGRTAGRSRQPASRGLRRPTRRPEIDGHPRCRGPPDRRVGYREAARDTHCVAHCGGNAPTVSWADTTARSSGSVRPGTTYSGSRAGPWALPRTSSHSRRGTAC